MEDFVISSIFVGAGLFILLGLVLLVVSIVGLCLLFKKTGEDWWKALIPFYNVYVLINIAGLNKYYFLLFAIQLLDFIPGMAVIDMIAIYVLNFFIFYNLGLKFEKEPIFMGCMSVFFQPILTLIIGVSKKYVYNKDIVVSQHGPIKEK